MLRSRGLAWTVSRRGSGDLKAIGQCNGAIYQLSILLGQMDTMLVNDSNSTFRSMKTVVAGALAGLVTVYATMPFDALKTRLQALDGRQRYRGSWNCLLSVIRNEGTFTLWRGTTPRLARLSVGLPYLLVWWCLIICTLFSGFWCCQLHYL